MTYFAMEEALWGVSQDGACAQALMNNPEDYLGRFNLSDEERENIRAFKVRAMADSGVSPLLLMQAWNAVRGADQIGAYLTEMNGA